jgi:hypothetical protein
MRFLRHTRMVQDTMSRPAFERAERAASQLVRMKLNMLLLLGGTPATVAQVCDRLLPGRVQPAVLTQIAAEPDDLHGGSPHSQTEYRGAGL